MDDQGFFPAHPCRRCNEGLKGEGGGYPAELYAGTYTGLCYSCTAEPSYHERTLETSGAHVWNHPPSCPAWRRDREAFYAFPECEECKGRGRIHVSRTDGRGGPYGKQCERCWNEHQTHPVVVEEHRNQSENMFLWCVISERAQIWFNITTKGMSDADREDLGAETVDLLRKVQKEQDPSLIPEKWPALKAADRKRVLKRAPEAVRDDNDLADLLFKIYGGNPRKKKKS